MPVDAENFKDALSQIESQPKRRYSREELDAARGDLALMNDRVFFVTFADNKNNHIITGIVNALRKIHGLAPIPPIERTTLQNMTLLDVLGRGMVGDMLGEGFLINIAVEVQKKGQDGYAVRGTITSSNITRVQFDAGEDYTEAPDVIGVNILGFRLPELKNRKMFCSRIVRAEYDSGEHFLADKYSDYYIELPKMSGFTKKKLPAEYHDIWDICSVFKAKVKEQERVIKMQAVTNPTALELSNEVKKAVTSDEVVTEALSREDELRQLWDYFNKRAEKTAEKKAQKLERAVKRAEKKAEQAARQAQQAVKQVEQAEKQAEQAARQAEKTIIIAIENNVSSDIIEIMRKSSGMTEARLAELKKQCQPV